MDVRTNQLQTIPTPTVPALTHMLTTLEDSAVNAGAAFEQLGEPTTACDGHDATRRHHNLFHSVRGKALRNRFRQWVEIFKMGLALIGYAQVCFKTRHAPPERLGDGLDTDFRARQAVNALKHAACGNLSVPILADYWIVLVMFFDRHKHL